MRIWTSLRGERWPAERVGMGLSPVPVPVEAVPVEAGPRDSRCPQVTSANDSARIHRTVAAQVNVSIGISPPHLPKESPSAQRLFSMLTRLENNSLAF